MKKSNIEVTYIDHMGSDLSVVNSARVSFHKKSDVLVSQDVKLLDYLAKHQHKSPFNHCFASFRIKAPIFVARQLVKHKFLPWNEVSRRYVSDEPEYMSIQWRWKAENKKQGSHGVVDKDTQQLADIIFWESVEVSHNAYLKLLAIGICPEQARAVTCLDAMTEWVWSGSLGAFGDMCRLRLDAHTQQETSEVPKQIGKHLSELFPSAWAALMCETS